MLAASTFDLKILCDDFGDGQVAFESELPTIADLIAPGTGRSISAEFECLLRVIANGER